MPKCLLNLVYSRNERNTVYCRQKYAAAHVSDQNVMRTRSGLSIKKVHTNAAYRESSSAVHIHAENEPQTGQHLTHVTKEISTVKQNVPNQLSSISIVTRYDMLMDGIEIDSSDLNTTNLPSKFLVTAAEVCDSILSAGNLTFESYRRQPQNVETIEPPAPTPIASIRVKSLSMSALSRPPPPLLRCQPPLLDRSISYPFSTLHHHAMPNAISTSARLKVGRPSPSAAVLRLLDKQSEIVIDNLSTEELFNRLSKFCIGLTPHAGIDALPSLFKCCICHRVYGGLAPFAEHINTHLKLKNKCHICGRVFSRNWLLKGHLRIHTGEKPFECDSCGKKFADKSNLRSHMLIHTVTNKTHPCEKCGKSFAQRRYLHKHMLEVCK